MDLVKTYLRLVALLFFIFGVAHILRLSFQWPIILGTLNVPMEVSWIAITVAFLLAITGFWCSFVPQQKDKQLREILQLLKKKS